MWRTTACSEATSTGSSSCWPHPSGRPCTGSVTGSRPRSSRSRTGNGIVLDHDIGRFVADAEALYSYEGTREINTLIVGRAVTGHSAFV